jgi:catechol 2,3-dioxygenase-like lactoylglutathione lyase family enzyme
MQLPVTGFSHVAIRVSDFARSRRFYVDVLGLPVLMEFEDAVIVKIGGSFMGVLGGAPETSRDVRFDPMRVGLDHVSLAVETVDDLERTKHELDAAKVRNDGIHDEPELNAKGLVFYDPDGIAVELYVIQR